MQKGPRRPANGTTSLQTVIKAKTEQLVKSKEELTYDNRRSAEERVNELDALIHKFSTALKKAEDEFNASDKKIEGIKAAISELNKQLSEEQHLDIDKEIKKSKGGDFRSGPFFILKLIINWCKSYDTRDRRDSKD